MTSGEKINYYRKQLGLSQEELGQKLLVSRQTISLWEKGQTVPTIDNLIRLKEIFGVSVDEILGCAEEGVAEEESMPSPREEYEFTYTREEFKKAIKLSNISLVKKCIAVVVFSFLCVMVGLFYEPTLYVGAFLLGVALTSTALIFSIVKSNKIQCKRAEEKFDRNIYSVKVYDNYFNVTITRDNEIVSFYKFCFSDIEKIEENGDYLYLVVSGVMFIFKKSELTDNSVFYSVIYKNPQKVIAKKTNNVWSLVLFILFLLSIASFFLAEMIMFALPDTAWQECCWSFYAVIPIPVLSVIFGIIFKIKGYKCTKNIIAGLLMTAILGAFGSAPYMMDDISDHTDEAIVAAETTIGIELPETKEINTYYWTEDEQYNEREYTYSSTDAWLSEEQADAFEKELAASDKWLTEASTALSALISENAGYAEYDYMLLYNVDTEEFNTVPDESGTYHFFYIGYNSELSSIQLAEYDIEYIK